MCCRPGGFLGLRSIPLVPYEIERDSSRRKNAISILPVRTIVTLKMRHG
jgi:hypothetical protein